MTLIIVLFLLGSALIVAEVMFPSFGILGLLAATCYLVAVLDAFAMGDTKGYLAVTSVLILIPLAIWLGFTVLKHSSIGNRLLLAGPKPEEVHGLAAGPKLKELIGTVGRAVTPLSPSGLVMVGERQIDAVSDGGYIDRNTPVRVSHVEGNRVVVEVIKGDADMIGI